MASVFSKAHTYLYARYACSIAFDDRIVGATPSDPKMIEGWLRKNMGLTNAEEIKDLTYQTLIELGLLDPDGIKEPEVKIENLKVASEIIAKKSKTQKFKRQPDGTLYIESRIIKAMVREAISIAYPWAGGHRLGATQKAPHGLLRERVFVAREHDKIPLLVDGHPTQEPSGVDLFLGHVVGPKGAHSTLQYYEYVEQPTINFDIEVFEDDIPDDWWETIWVVSEENGMGGMRSQGFGRFSVTRWDHVRQAHRVAKPSKSAAAVKAEEEGVKVGKQPKTGVGLPRDAEDIQERLRTLVNNHEVVRA